MGSLIIIKTVNYFYYISGEKGECLANEYQNYNSLEKVSKLKKGSYGKVKEKESKRISILFLYQGFLMTTGTFRVMLVISKRRYNSTVDTNRLILR